MLTDFRNKVPSLALSFPNTDGMVSLLDGMYNYKKSLQDHFFRSYNAALNPYRADLETYLVDAGFPRFAEPLPLVILHTLALNAGNIMRYRGSERGIKLFLQSMTLGKVAIQLEDFYPKSLAIFPNDLDTGFLPNEPAEDAWYVYTAEEENLDSSFSAHIETYFSDSSAVKRYVTSHLAKFLPFYESFTPPPVTFACGPIRLVDNMPTHFNFGFVASDAAYLYYDVVKTLFDSGLRSAVLSFDCLFDTAAVYSDGIPESEPTFPPTSCDLLPFDYLIVTDYFGRCVNAINESTGNNPDAEVLNAECLNETVFLYCQVEPTITSEAPSLSSLDFLIQQAYSL